MRACHPHRLTTLAEIYDSFEEIVNSARDQAYGGVRRRRRRHPRRGAGGCRRRRRRPTSRRSLHGVSFTRSGLTVGEESTGVAFQHALDELAPTRGLVDGIGVAGVVEDSVEGVRSRLVVTAADKVAGEGTIVGVGGQRGRGVAGLVR